MTTTTVAIIGTLHARTCTDCLALAPAAQAKADLTDRPTATARDHAHAVTVQTRLVDMVSVAELAYRIYDDPRHEGALRSWEPELVPPGVGAIPADDAREVWRRSREEWDARTAAAVARDTAVSVGSRFD